MFHLLFNFSLSQYFVLGSVKEHNIRATIYVVVEGNVEIVVKGVIF